MGQYRGSGRDPLAQVGNPTPVAGTTIRRQSDPREEPDALASTSGFVRGAPGNRRSYRDVRQVNWCQCSR